MFRRFDWAPREQQQTIAEWRVSPAAQQWLVTDIVNVVADYVNAGEPTGISVIPNSSLGKLARYWSFNEWFVYEPVNPNQCWTWHGINTSNACNVKTLESLHYRNRFMLTPDGLMYSNIYVLDNQYLTRKQVSQAPDCERYTVIYDGVAKAYHREVFWHVQRDPIRDMMTRLIGCGNPTDCADFYAETLRKKLPTSLFYGESWYLITMYEYVIIRGLTYFLSCDGGKTFTECASTPIITGPDTVWLSVKTVIHRGKQYEINVPSDVVKIVGGWGSIIWVKMRDDTVCAADVLY